MFNEIYRQLRHKMEENVIKTRGDLCPLHTSVKLHNFFHSFIIHETKLFFVAFCGTMMESGKIRKVPNSAPLHCNRNLVSSCPEKQFVVHFFLWGIRFNNCRSCLKSGFRGRLSHLTSRCNKNGKNEMKGVNRIAVPKMFSDHLRMV